MVYPRHCPRAGPTAAGLPVTGYSDRRRFIVGIDAGVALTLAAFSRTDRIGGFITSCEAYRPVWLAMKP
jgi:hypothetical protein